MLKVKISKEQLKILVQAQGCTCTEWQWSHRASHCTMHWIRCKGRWNWSVKNNPATIKALAKLKSA
jgi:hypothetical protein